MVDSTSKTVRVRQVGSPIRRDRKQSLHLKSLGLRGIGSERELVVNSTVLGLLRKARHLIIEVAPGVAAKAPVAQKSAAGSKATATNLADKEAKADAGKSAVVSESAVTSGSTEKAAK
jgi:large subunit ribosomal protein L30